MKNIIISLILSQLFFFISIVSKKLFLGEKSFTFMQGSNEVLEVCGIHWIRETQNVEGNVVRVHVLVGVEVIL